MTAFAADGKTLPDPLTPAECDLRGLPFMPLDVRRLRDSDLVATASAEGFRCAVLLWCAAWEQVPAASLPNDDRMLAQLAGFGRFVAQFQAVKDEALYGFVLCSDGRWHHPVIAEKASEAWRSRQRQREKAAKRWTKSDDQTPPSGGSHPDKPVAHQSRHGASSMPRHNGSDAAASESQSHSSDNSMQGRGRGRVKGQGYNPSSASACATEKCEPETEPIGADEPSRAEIFRRCVSAAGPGLADPQREPQLTLTAARIGAALAAGCDLEADILPVITHRTAKARGSPITTWSYFERAWIDARDRRLANLPPPNPERFAGETANAQHHQGRPTRNDPGAQRAIRLAAWGDLLAERGELEALGPGTPAG